MLKEYLKAKQNQNEPFRRIFSDDDSPLKNLSPLFVADGEFAKPSVLARFRAESAELPQPVREYVIDRIQAFPGGAWLWDEAVSGQRRSDP